MGFQIKKDADGFERLIFGEVIIPHEVNVFGDYHTEESVRQFAYGFMIQGFQFDTEHDNNPLSGIKIVESFIARPGDPDFIQGSWVLGCHVEDDATWQKILDNEINGYSYEALCTFMELQMSSSSAGFFFGVTQPSVFDGHSHHFFVVTDDNGRVISGGTDMVDGHRHEIISHSFTERSLGHSHIYRILESDHA